MANSAQDLDHVNIPTDIDGLCVPPNRRYGISHRIASGEASKAELLHHLLGAHAENTLVGALAELHVLAEIVASGCADKRHVGTVANVVVNRLEVLICLAEELDLDGDPA